uniref:E3 ubiquitin-protein ligase RNF181 n=1 Tax=Clastoptera arizonana TaxID=38151 RepID=A0A1B6EE45_9HEMI
MVSYFEEMNWIPLGDEDYDSTNGYLRLVRYLIRGGDEDFTTGGLILAPPASKDVVKNLPLHKIKTKDEQCTVCLKMFEVNEEVKLMPCKHEFHSDCILPWLSKTNSCPLCRHELPTDDDAYEEIRKQKLRAKQRELDIQVLHNSMFS